ncbi:hypothetical protein CMO94_03140 [Candidatus Woesearchaeota archaeon]|jgi:hypothetical protein|nr:hypothetical protein [Candidatus Woesearchaeota archaeon]
MTYIQPTKETLKARLTAYFEASGFINLDAGTPENALLNILTDNLYSMYQNLTEAYSSSLPLNASSSNLDSWSNFFGLKRTTAIRAIDLTTNNIHFFVRDTANIEADILIPLGTLVSDNGSKIYKTIEDVTLPSTIPNIVFAKVEAVTSGSASNVTAGELSTHDLNYDFIEVSNRFSISNGGDVETDSSVQLSLQSLFGKRIGTNMESIIELISSVPGVSQATMFNADRGTGTFSIFIDSTSPVVTDSLLAQAQAVLGSLKAIGTTGYITRPTYKGISMKIELMSVDGSNITNLVDTDLTSDIVNTINNLSRGSQLDVKALVRLVLNHPSVLDADLSEFSIGDYDVTQNKLLNIELKTGGKQILGPYEKWFCSSDLITYCMVSYG